MSPLHYFLLYPPYLTFTNAQQGLFGVLDYGVGYEALEGQMTNWCNYVERHVQPT